MDPRIREDDKSAEQVRPFDKLRDRVTKARCEGCPRASEAKGPLPAEEGWVMEKKERKERRKKKNKSSLKPICTQHTRG